MPFWVCMFQTSIDPHKNNKMEWIHAQEQLLKLTWMLGAGEGPLTKNQHNGQCYQLHHWFKIHTPFFQDGAAERLILNFLETKAQNTKVQNCRYLEKSCCLSPKKHCLNLPRIKLEPPECSRINVFCQCFQSSLSHSQDANIHRKGMPIWSLSFRGIYWAVQSFFRSCGLFIRPVAFKTTVTASRNSSVFLKVESSVLVMDWLTTNWFCQEC